MIRRVKTLSLCSLALPLVWVLAGCGGGDTTKKPTTTSPKVTEDTKPAKSEDTTASKGKEAAEPARGDEGWGTIRGQVVWAGEVPEPVLIHNQGSDVKDKEVCAAQDLYSEEVVVNKGNKGLKWVGLWIAGNPKIHPDLATPDGTAEMGQQNCHFIPHLLIMRKGQKFVISSNDPVSHNTKGDPFRNPGFNPTVPPGKPEEKNVIPGPELDAENRPFPISCNIHPWMKARMHVLAHPYFAVTDDDGKFEIEHVPAGTQKLVISHDLGWGEGGAKGKDITVKAGETTDLGQIEYTPPKS